MCEGYVYRQKFGVKFQEGDGGLRNIILLLIAPVVNSSSSLHNVSISLCKLSCQVHEVNIEDF